MAAVCNAAPRRGPADAEVTVTVFGDYLCPFTARLAPELAKLRDVAVEWRHRPLAMHPGAARLAEAAAEAHAQGRFWAMHAALLAGLDVEAAARKAGLNRKKLRAALADGRHRPALEADRALATRLRVGASPAVFVNGRPVAGDLSAAIAEARAHPNAKTGTPWRPPILAPRRYDLPVTADSPARGPASAPVTVVEFADFQCAPCARVAPSLAKLVREHGVRHVYRVYTSPRHRQASLAARAAFAAQAQGRFWPMHDRLYARGGLDRASLVAHARALGLDLARFERDLDAPATQRRLETDVAAAQSLDVWGTPTFFVGGRKIAGALPYAELVRLVTSAPPASTSDSGTAPAGAPPRPPRLPAAADPG